MAEGNVLLPKNVDVNQLKYSQPKTLSNGSRTVYITHNSSKLSIQTPIMRFPYGVGEGYEADKAAQTQAPANDKKPPSYDLHVSFGGHEDTPKMKNMLDLMLSLETQVKKDAFKNRVEWFDDDFDGIEQVVNKLFTPVVKYDKDKQTKKIIGKYPPTMKLKLPYDLKKDNFAFDSQDMDGNEIDFKAVMRNLRGGRGKFIVQLSGLWFAGGKFGCTWKVVNAKVEGSSVQKNLKFIEESDEEDEKKADPVSDDDADLVADAINNAGPAAAPAANVAIVAESDDDDEEDAEEEEADEDDEPPPPPPPAKKSSAATAAKKGGKK